MANVIFGLMNPVKFGERILLHLSIDMMILINNEECVG